MKKVGIVLLLISIILLAGGFLLMKRRVMQPVTKPVHELQEEIPLEIKIGQMIVIGYCNVEPFKESIYKDVENNRISGLIFYKRDIKSPNEILNKINNLKAINKKYPLFMVVDQEGGLVSRIANDNGYQTYPSAVNIAKKHTSKEAYQIYSNMARDLKKSGFNFNLAPCVDTITNKNSFMSMRQRSYGNNPETVYKYSVEFIKAHSDNGIITTLKHFPGTGNAVFDSHKTLPDITNTWKESELIPFNKIIKEFPDEPVMIGHVFNKKIDDKYISSLSEKTINMLSTVKHEGVVVADAYDMDAVNKYSIDEILIKAINSGVNLFIFPNHSPYENDLRLNMKPEEFIRIVKTAVYNGLIPEEKISSSYDKIILLKKTFIKEK